MFPSHDTVLLPIRLIAILGDPIGNYFDVCDLLILSNRWNASQRPFIHFYFINQWIIYLVGHYIFISFNCIFMICFIILFCIVQWIARPDTYSIEDGDPRKWKGNGFCDHLEVWCYKRKKKKEFFLYFHLFAYKNNLESPFAPWYITWYHHLQIWSFQRKKSFFAHSNSLAH